MDESWETALKAESSSCRRVCQTSNSRRVAPTGAYLEVGNLARLRLHEIILPAGLVVGAVQQGAHIVDAVDQLLDARVPLDELVLERRGLVAEHHAAQLEAAGLLVLDQEIAAVDGVAVLGVELVQHVGSLSPIGG